MYRLTNVLRPYAWGSATAIAELFGREPSGGPEAELWIGAHPDSPSMAQLADRRRGRWTNSSRRIREPPSVNRCWACLAPPCRS